MPVKVNDLIEGLRTSISTIKVTANQLDDWAEASIRGGWSIQQVEPMRAHADKLRRQANDLKRMLAENTEGQS